MVTSSFLGWDLLSEQGLMSSFPLQRPLFSPSARLAALFFPILPLLPVEQARWDLPDRRYRLFTLLHETISSALPISLRISWDLCPKSRHEPDYERDGSRIYCLDAPPKPIMGILYERNVPGYLSNDNFMSLIKSTKQVLRLPGIIFSLRSKSFLRWLASLTCGWTRRRERKY